MLQEARLETSRAIKHTPSSLSPRQSQAQWDRLAWHDIMPCENKQGRYWKEDTERQGHPFSGNLSFPFPYWDLGDNWVTAGNRKTWALSTQCPSVPPCQQKSNHTNYFLIMVAVSAVKKGDRTIYKWLRPKLEDQQQLITRRIRKGKMWAQAWSQRELGSSEDTEVRMVENRQKGALPPPPSLWWRSGGGSWTTTTRGAAEMCVWKTLNLWDLSCQQGEQRLRPEEMFWERLLLTWTSGLSTPGNTPEKTRDKKDRWGTWLCQPELSMPMTAIGVR